MDLTIGYLYPDLMNIYGDTGNIITLKKRAEWRGIDVVIKMFSIGNSLKQRDADLFFFGGGQDQQQSLVASDLESSDKGKIIKSEVERGVPLLSICGGYQLLGGYYKPHKGQRLPGVGLFPAYTVASFDRMIGNIVIKVNGSWLLVHGKDNKNTMNLFVGFENHSGKTYLKKGALPLGMVIRGFGNNGADKTEGCIYKNAIGCYMHGSLLPKNPHLADWLLQKALEVKYGSPRGEAGKEIELKPLEDDLEIKAYIATVQRFG